MKKRIIMVIFAVTSIGLFAACGSKGTAETIEEANDYVEEINDEGTEEAPVMLGNPMQDSSEAEIKAELGAEFNIPAEAENINYFMYRIEGGDFGEIQFTHYGMDCTLRVQKANEFTEISGMEYDWDWTEHGKLGECEQMDMRFVGENEAVEVSDWYDSANGIMYSLSVYANDLDGYDIIALTNEISGLSYVPGDMEEFEGFMPNDFLQERTGIDIFQSYEEMISYLQPGEGYGYITLDGYDGKILVISDGIFSSEGENVALATYLYAETGDQRVENIGNEFSTGTAYPIRCDGHAIFAAGNHNYECLVLTDDARPGLMVLETITEVYNNDGDEAVAEYFGFIRHSNDLFDDGDDVDITTQEEFYAYVDKYLAADAITFTIVE